MKSLAILSLAIASSACFGQFTPVPAAMTDIKWMVGNWKGDLVLSPAGQEMVVPSTLSTVMEGPHMKSVMTMEMGATKFVETLYTSWDEKNKVYKGYAFASWANLPRIETMKREGDKFTISCEPWEAMGQMMLTRGELVRLSDDQFTFKLEQKEGSEWTLMGSCTYTRVK